MELRAHEVMPTWFEAVKQADPWNPNPWSPICAPLSPQSRVVSPSGNPVLAVGLLVPDPEFPG
jgi:hypothetical protein